MNRKLFALFLIGILFFACHTKSKEQILLEKNVKDGAEQVVLVYNEMPEDSKATLFAFEKTPKGWKKVFSAIPAGVGKNGFADYGQKREGDGKSPSGYFSFGNLFVYDKYVDTQMPYMQSTAEDKWIDDPESQDYNTHVRGETAAKSYENLLLRNDYYKYCMVIEYNTSPVEKGKGSAIFFHLNMKEYESTAGCVAIIEENMLKLLKWMDPEKHPMILMGNKHKLFEGLVP